MNLQMCIMCKFANENINEKISQLVKKWQLNLQKSVMSK